MPRSRSTRAAARSPGTLEHREEPIASSDIVGCPASAVFDAPLTNVVDGTHVKVIAW